MGSGLQRRSPCDVQKKRNARDGMREEVARQELDIPFLNYKVRGKRMRDDRLP